MNEDKMQRWTNDGDDGLSWFRSCARLQRWLSDGEIDMSTFIGYGGAADGANESGSA